MPNQKLVFIQDKVSIEQPDFEKFYYRNIDVLRKLLKCPNQDGRIGLPIAHTEEESENMRISLIDWLRQINTYRQSKPGVLALAVEIVDNYVYEAINSEFPKAIDTNNYQCAGAAAYHLASKLEEVTPMTPDELARYSKESCSSADILSFEIIISHQLKFNTKFVTPIEYIYILVGFIDLPMQSKIKKSAVKCYIDVIDNLDVKKYPPYILAINSIIIGYYDIEFDTNNNNNKVNNQEINNPEIQLNKIVDLLMKLVNPDKNKLSECYDMMNSLIDAKKSQCVDINSSFEIIGGI